MNSLQFKKNELKKLCSIIGSKPSDIELIVSNIDEHYREWTEQKLDKKTGDYKRYKDGTLKERVIRPPQVVLSKIQTQIKDKILAPIILPECVHGGVKKEAT